jgi:predicted O-methyltransferase YrrM/ketosteroid isomerase-like protein
MRTAMLAVLPSVLFPLAAIPAAAPDFTALTRQAQDAFDRADAAAAEELLCADAIAVRPDGLVTAGARLVATLRGAPRPAPVARSWGELQVSRSGDVAIVVGPTTVEGRWGRAESLLTAVWRVPTNAAPCLVLHHRAVGGDAAAAGQWDAAFMTSQTINREPNRWLASAVQGVKPGRALDVGVGQGRNAVFLAKQGWTVTGIDIAGEGMRLAREQAAAAGVKIDTVYASDRDFDFGREQWDLVAFIYMPVRGFPAKVYASLRPGGLVVAEAFGNAGDPARAGDDVHYGPDEMRRVFEAAGFEIVRYEEPIDVADYGLQRVPLVRLVARRPAR